MKRILNICVTSLTVMLILSLSFYNCFAKGALTLDKGVSVACKDTLTYTLYLADCEKPVTDMAAYLFYDSCYLKLDRDSVDFHDLAGVNRNLNLDGVIPFNFSTIGAPVDFSLKTPVVSVDFEVIKEGVSSIQYFISDLDCGDINDSVSVSEFTLSCDYVVHSSNGDKAIEDLTPVILDNKDKIDEYQGGFINYADGKGKQDSHSGSHIAVTGAADSGVVDVTRDSDGNSTIIITAAVIVIILVVIMLLILRRALNSDNKSEYENSENG